MWNIVYLLFFTLLACESEENAKEKNFISDDSVLSKLKKDADGTVSIQKLLAALPPESESEPELESDDRVSSSLPLESQGQQDSDTNLTAAPSCSRLRTAGTLSKSAYEQFYEAGICVVEAGRVKLNCLAKYIYNRCFKPHLASANKGSSYVVTCTQQGTGDQFSVTRNRYGLQGKNRLRCDVIDNRDNQPLIYGFEVRARGTDCQPEWEREKAINSYRCSDDRYVTLLHDGGRGTKLKLNLNGQDFSISRKECIKVPVHELEHISVTVGEEEVCKPGEGSDNTDCREKFYKHYSARSYGYAIRKMSTGILGSPPYWYYYKHLDRALKGCEEINH